jgi:two-component system LytT family response regulator
MIKCVIIDDEVNCREDLRLTIERHFKNRLVVVGMCESVAEGKTRIRATLPDVVFLDINMPREDGFKLFEDFNDLNFEVVFTTAYPEYAIRAIKNAAFDYLIKPVDPKEIEQFLDRFEQKSIHNSTNKKFNLLLNQLQHGFDKSVLVSLPDKKEFKVVDAREIVYCKADINYTEIFLSDGKSILVTKTLGVVEEILDFPFFFRCHKSYLVNVNHIESYNKTDRIIRLKNGKEIDLADRRVEEFNNIFGSRI